MNVTTTHDPHGGGHPRLVFWAEDDEQMVQGSPFALLPGVTVIGSGVDADLHLPGIDEHQGEVLRDAADEYVYIHLGPHTPSRVDGRMVGEKTLHTGDRIQLGEWTLVFAREEFADHGRPYGGRQGGAGSHQRSQQEPRARGTSTEGGSDPHGDNPGEYF